MNKEDLIELRDNVQAIIDGKEMEFYGSGTKKWYPYNPEQGSLSDICTMKLKVKPEPLILEVNCFGQMILNDGIMQTLIGSSTEFKKPCKFIEVLDD